MRTVLFSHFFVSPGGVRLDFSFPYSSPPSEWISIGSPLRHSNRAKPPGPIRQLQNLHLNSKEERKAKKKRKQKKTTTTATDKRNETALRRVAGDKGPARRNQKKKMVTKRRNTFTVGSLGPGKKLAFLFFHACLFLFFIPLGRISRKTPTACALQSRRRFDAAAAAAAAVFDGLLMRLGAPFCGELQQQPATAALCVFFFSFYLFFLPGFCTGFCPVAPAVAEQRRRIDAAPAPPVGNSRNDWRPSFFGVCVCVCVCVCARRPR